MKNLNVKLVLQSLIGLAGYATWAVMAYADPTLRRDFLTFNISMAVGTIGLVLRDMQPANAAPPASSGDKQAGRAMPVLLLIMAVGAALAMGGCGTLNAWNSGMLTKGAGDYTAAKINLQKTDDMKLQAWIDSACAMNVGALQRAASTSGNGNAITAVFTACPVPGVGVTSNMPNGSLTVQTTTLQAPATPK